MTTTKHIRTFNESCIGGRGQEVSRRDFLGGTGALITGAAIVAVLPVTAFAAAKSKQKAVKYQAMPKNNRKCSDCAFFQASDNTCKVVEGTVAPEGWCLRWAKKKA